MSSLRNFDFVTIMNSEIRKYKRKNIKLVIFKDEIYDFVTFKSIEIISKYNLNLVHEKEKLEALSKSRVQDNKFNSTLYISLCVVLLTGIVQSMLEILKCENIQIVLNLSIGYYFLAICTISLILIETIYNTRRNRNYIIYSAGINSLEKLIQENQQKSKKQTNKIVKPKPRIKRK